MISHRITSADLVGITGYTRHKLRSLLRELLGFVDDSRTARVAREYSMQEMILVAICCQLEDQCGLRRDAIAALEPELRKLLSRPRESTLSLHLAVSLAPPSASYVVGTNSRYTGTTLDLVPILENIDRYLMSDQRGYYRDIQQALDFGPHPVGHSSNKSAVVPGGHVIRKKHGTG
jgi:hypothetical protein